MHVAGRLETFREGLKQEFTFFEGLAFAHLSDARRCSTLRANNASWNGDGFHDRSGTQDRIRRRLDELCKKLEPRTYFFETAAFGRE